MGRLVVWGAGELGGRVARGWAASGRPVLAITRTTDRHAELRTARVTCAVSLGLPPLEGGDRLVLALPGAAAQHEAIARLAQHPVAAANVERAVLVSSTGFYGTRSGALDESSAVGAEADARRVAACEAAFRGTLAARGVVVRLAGLYRLGRGPCAALAARNQVPLGAPNKTLGLVHYDDAAAAILAAIDHARPEATYLVAASPCPTRRDFYEAACAKLGLPLPPFGPPHPGASATYDVARMRRDLLPRPSHPDWRDALA